MDGHFYSIPEHRLCGDLVVTESVSASPQGKEDHMIQSQQSLRTWADRNHVFLVLLLSLVHVLLAVLHTRDSGKSGRGFPGGWHPFPAEINPGDRGEAAREGMPVASRFGNSGGDGRLIPYYW